MNPIEHRVLLPSGAVVTATCTVGNNYNWEINVELTSYGRKILSAPDIPDQQFLEKTEIEMNISPRLSVRISLNFDGSVRQVRFFDPETTYEVEGRYLEEDIEAA